MPPPSLLLFDPYAGGHHAEHFRHIMSAWREREVAGGLLAAVSPRLTEQHPDLRALTAAAGGTTVDLVEMAEAPTLEGLGLVQIGVRHRRMLRRLVEEHRPEHVLLMYMDHAQLALAAGLRFSAPVRVSGILFRPSFHYGAFETTAPSLPERVTRLRKRLVLAAALRNPHVDTVFSLDPTAVPALQALAHPGIHAVALPDPVEVGQAHTDRQAMRDAFGIEPERQLFLLFGALDPRKGVAQLLHAVRRLPEPEARGVAVLLAGRLTASARPQIEALAADVSRASAAQIVLSDAFVPDQQIQSLVRASDLVLVPYQRHIGSSGVLIRAAAAGRPVLSQDYGVMGQQVREHRLGQAVDTTRPDAIARALRTFLAAPETGFDPGRAAAFAEANSVEAYLDTLFARLVPSGH